MLLRHRALPFRTAISPRGDLAAATAALGLRTTGIIFA
jgi:hypothetical protein